MRVELHPVFNVHIFLEDLHNIDLATRGYYQVRLVPKASQLFTSVDIQYVECNSGSFGPSILAPSVLNGTGVSRSVELTYIDETLLIGDTFLVSIRLGPQADLGLTYHLAVDVELWSMDRHRPPNISLFELETYGAVTITAYGSLVSVLPRRRRQPPDPTIDAKSRNVHLSAGSTLLHAMCSIERFVVRNQKSMVASVHTDACDVMAEMESLRSRLDSAVNPWNEIENTAVNLSARLSLLYSQLVRLCIGSPAISSSLLQGYRKFREKMLSELFFFMERSQPDLSTSHCLDKVFSLVSRSKYLEKLPRYPIFCYGLDSSPDNWCLIVEERLLVNHPSTSDESGRRVKKVSSASTQAEGDGFRDTHRSSLRGTESRIPWLRRKSSNEKSHSLHYADFNQTLQCNPEGRPESALFEDGLSSTVEFVMERERLKAVLLEQRLFDGYLYSEQASPWRCSPSISKKQSSHLVVFVHGLEGTCDDLSSYRNIFRVVADNVPGFCYLLSASNHYKTWSNFDEMADNLLAEVHSYVSRYSELPARISFVAHSLGGVIVRTAVSREDASDWLVPRLHCFLTINTPHLGLAYVGRGISLGIHFMQWWKQSRSMEQLSLKDEVSFSDSFLYKLSKRRTFGLFRCVLLIGTPADTFVPCHSSLLAPCKSANKDLSALGTAYRDMLSNVHEDILSSERTTTTIRYSTWHNVSSPRASKLTGRATHIAAVEDDVFIEKLFAISALKYFME
ncbi:DUF676 domain-containing protein [Trichostrongylus colubriformis]|uniref:DUF676 domain-containing protein n=1 Tax=Trichostrongylus colubriformis TaxID=6319 RepID=A0AAN8IA22_TRICO